MAKTVREAFAMSDEDEFFEENSEEDGNDDSGNSDQSEGSEEQEMGSGNVGGESGGDGSDDPGDDGETKGEGEEEKGDSGEEPAGKTETGEGEKGEGGTGEPEGSGDDEDLFADLEGKGSEGEEKVPAIDFKKIGSVLDIELEHGTEEEFTEKVKKRIEASRQEVDLDKFTPEARRLVKHLHENEGKIGDFFVNNKITQLQSIIAMEPEEKLRMVRLSSFSKEGKTDEEIEQELSEEISSMGARRIIEEAKRIDDNARSLMNKEIEEIVGAGEKTAEDRKAQKQNEIKQRNENLKNFVQKTDNFLGMKLSEKAKSTITRDIDSGRFDQVADLTDAEVRFAAYMIKRSGGKISERITNLLSEKNREGYNNALDKMTGKLHKSKEEAQSKRSGHQEGSAEKKNFDRFADIE